MFLQTVMFKPIDQLSAGSSSQYKLKSSLMLNYSFIGQHLHHLKSSCGHKKEEEKEGKCKGRCLKNTAFQLLCHDCPLKSQQSALQTMSTFHTQEHLTKALMSISIWGLGKACNCLELVSCNSWVGSTERVLSCVLV